MADTPLLFGRAKFTEWHARACIAFARLFAPVSFTVASRAVADCTDLCGIRAGPLRPITVVAGSTLSFRDADCSEGHACLVVTRALFFITVRLAVASCSGFDVAF